MFANEAERIIRWTAKAGLPPMYSWRIFVEGGGLMSYSTDLAAIYRRAATRGCGESRDDGAPELTEGNWLRGPRPASASGEVMTSV
jgi:hypothetical protein